MADNKFPSEMVDLPKFSQDSVNKAKGADSSFIKPNSQKRRVTMRDKMKEINEAYACLKDSKKNPSLPLTFVSFIACKP